MSEGTVSQEKHLDIGMPYSYTDHCPSTVHRAGAAGSVLHVRRALPILACSGCFCLGLPSPTALGSTLDTTLLEAQTRLS